jgi:hypothetical protein
MPDAPSIDFAGRGNAFGVAFGVADAVGVADAFGDIGVSTRTFFNADAFGDIGVSTRTFL